MEANKTQQARIEDRIDPICRRVGGLQIQPTVFFGSAGIILAVLIFGVGFPAVAEKIFSAVLNAINANGGWFYVLCVNVFLVFSIYLACSPLGRIRLGGPDARPNYSRWSWFAMLFSAGMGIGLLFYSVAEPIGFFTDPPFGAEPETAAAAAQAMALTHFHWGFHAWGIYGVVAIAIAFFAYNKGLPLTIRSAFHPLIGDRIYGPAGNLIDLLAVVATMFGVATSLGLGAMQVNAGLQWLFPQVGYGVFSQIVLIVFITICATVSVVLGLDRGIRVLSEFNIVVASALLIAVFLLGPTVFLIDTFFQNVGTYLGRLTSMSLWSQGYQETRGHHGGTVFYWGWWIAWAPFVGMFIARVSFGRTVREFVVGVLLVPTLINCLWLSVFGNAALHVELFGSGGLVAMVDENFAMALFELLGTYPFSSFTALVAILVITVFFVTSSDSGSLVIDTITAGGHPHPPVGQKVFWAVTEGLVAIALLMAGGLSALQTGAVSTGLPFALVILVMCFGLHRGLRDELRRVEGKPIHREPTTHPRTDTTT